MRPAPPPHLYAISKRPGGLGAPEQADVRDAAVGFETAPQHAPRAAGARARVLKTTAVAVLRKCDAHVNLPARP